MVSGRISRRALLGGTAAIAISAAACSGTSTPSATPKTLSVGATLEPPTLDPTMSDAASIPQLLLYNVYETLVKLDSDGNIKPLLAERWDVSSDRTTYTFTLQQGAKFASGTAVDAAAVVAGIQRMRNSTSATIKSQLAPIASVSAQDSSTVVVTLSQPSNAWLYSMTSTAGMIVDPAITDMATKPMGSGPFAFSTWTKGDSITLAKNTNYWGTPGRFDEVMFRYYVDPNAMITAMLSGDLDIISNLQAPQSLSQFADTTKYTIVEGTTTGEVTMGFNHSNAALAQLKVRQAICYAIDRKALLNTVWAGHGQLIGSHAAAHRAVLRGPVQHLPVRPGEGQGAPRRSRRDQPRAEAPSAHHEVRDRLGHLRPEPAQGRRHHRDHRAARLLPLAHGGLHQRRLRHDDRRPRRAT